MKKRFRIDPAEITEGGDAIYDVHVFLEAIDRRIKARLAQFGAAILAGLVVGAVVKEVFF